MSFRYVEFLTRVGLEKDLSLQITPGNCRSVTAQIQLSRPPENILTNGGLCSMRRTCYKKARALERITIAFHRIVAFLVTHLGYREIIPDLILLPCLVLAWNMPRMGNRVLGAIERVGAHLADRKRLAIVLIVAAAILVRLSPLWLLPIPAPLVHDEFVHLLAGDTFAHGRIASPTHPMWLLFDTIHVNQHPTYISKYPPAQSAVLAVGQVLGDPWFGVLLSVALMCAAVL